MKGQGIVVFYCAQHYTSYGVVNVGSRILPEQSPGHAGEKHQPCREAWVCSLTPVRHKLHLVYKDFAHRKVMETIYVTREGNKIVGTTKGGHVAFTIIPAVSSVEEALHEMYTETEASFAKMAAGVVLSSLLYGEDYYEHAEWIMDAKEALLKRRAENHMIQCLDFDYELFSDCGEVNCTKLAEEAAKHLDHDEWLDDETHWIWDMAFEVADDPARQNPRLPLM